MGVPFLAARVAQVYLKSCALSLSTPITAPSVLTRSEMRSAVSSVSAIFIGLS